MKAVVATLPFVALELSIVATDSVAKIIADGNSCCYDLIPRVGIVYGGKRQRGTNGSRWKQLLLLSHSSCLEFCIMATDNVAETIAEGNSCWYYLIPRVGVVYRGSGQRGVNGSRWKQLLLLSHSSCWNCISWQQTTWQQ